MTNEDLRPFRRTVTLSTTPGAAGSRIHRATVDDPMHGFTVELHCVDDRIVDASAVAPRHPWTTCPGSLASVAALRGPLAGAAAAMVRAPRDTTCVHLNDLVRLAAAGHRARSYEVVVTPRSLVARRDGVEVADCELADWTVTAPPPLAGLRLGDAGWRALDEAVGDTGDELGRVVRRALSVAMGYHLLPWADIEVAADVAYEAMTNSCHTFSDARVAEAGCLVRLPRP
ncbi:MAG: DUF2889 domain-containing protein [Acidimicrobiales bacterium]|nr:DUF2889 domain-containing protein [Acidimicrobiales bacterium]